MRIYEEKIYLCSAPTVLAWHFFIHDDNSIEYLKQPELVTAADRKMIDLTIGTMMTAMNNSNIADMKCLFVS